MKKKQTVKTYNHKKDICCKWECKNIIEFAKRSWRRKLKKDLKNEL